MKRQKNIKRVKVSPEEIHLEFKTKSGKRVLFKAIRPKADVKIIKKETSK